MVKNKLNIKGMDVADRPREKLMLQGRRLLTDAELMAILIGGGNTTENAVELCKRILKYYNFNLYEAGQASVKDLCKFSGIGKVKALSIIAALELGRRRRDYAEPQNSKIVFSKDIFELMHPVFADLNHEEFWVLFLNKANRLLGKFMISKGGMTGTVADPKVIFKTALEKNAAYLMLTHNHPSGNLNPSQEDINITKKLRDLGAMMDMHVLDHLIITNSGYFSFADEGIIFV